MRAFEVVAVIVTLLVCLAMIVAENESIGLVCGPHQTVQVERRSDGTKAVRCLDRAPAVEVLP